MCGASGGMPLSSHYLPCTNMTSWNGLLPTSCNGSPKAVASSRNLPPSTKQCAAVTHSPSSEMRVMEPMACPRHISLPTYSARSDGCGTLPVAPGNNIKGKADHTCCSRALVHKKKSASSLHVAHGVACRVLLIHRSTAACCAMTFSIAGDKQAPLRGGV